MCVGDEADFGWLRRAPYLFSARTYRSSIIASLATSSRYPSNRSTDDVVTPAPTFALRAARKANTIDSPSAGEHATASLGCGTLWAASRSGSRSNRTINRRIVLARTPRWCTRLQGACSVQSRQQLESAKCPSARTQGSQALGQNKGMSQPLLLTAR